VNPQAAEAIGQGGLIFGPCEPQLSLALLRFETWAGNEQKVPMASLTPRFYRIQFQLPRLQCSPRLCSWIWWGGFTAGKVPVDCSYLWPAHFCDLRPWQRMGRKFSYLKHYSGFYISTMSTF